MGTADGSLGKIGWGESRTNGTQGDLPELYHMQPGIKDGFSNISSESRRVLIGKSAEQSAAGAEWKCSIAELRWSMALANTNLR